MAAATPPTFKLVLVGDGGTGKVDIYSSGPALEQRLTRDRPLSSRGI